MMTVRWWDWWCGGRRCGHAKQRQRQQGQRHVHDQRFASITVSDRLQWKATVFLQDKDMHLEQPHAHPLSIQKCVHIRPMVDDVHVPGRIVGAGVAMDVAGAPGGGGGGGDARHIAGGA